MKINNKAVSYDHKPSGGSDARTTYSQAFINFSSLNQQSNSQCQLHHHFLNLFFHTSVVLSLTAQHLSPPQICSYSPHNNIATHIAFPHYNIYNTFSSSWISYNYTQFMLNLSFLFAFSWVSLPYLNFSQVYFHTSYIGNMNRIFCLIDNTYSMIFGTYYFYKDIPILFFLNLPSSSYSSLLYNFDNIIP